MEQTYDDVLIACGFDPDAPPEPDAAEDKPGRAQRMRVHTETGKKRYDVRRFISEQHVMETMDWYWNQGVTYNIISAGDVDFLTFVRHALRQQPAEYLLLSSWCFGVEDVAEIASWIDRGFVGRFDCYMGEIAQAIYAKCQEDLTTAAQKTGGRVGVLRNHSKVGVIYGDAFDCVICSSANINTNPRAENTIITCDTDVADFYKSFFDGIHPFNPTPKTWTPYQRGARNASKQTL